MIDAIMKIHTTSSSVTFECGDIAIIGNGEFRASSGKVDGFIPVSYTHLDVYKRQIAGTSDGSPTKSYNLMFECERSKPYENL